MATPYVDIYKVFNTRLTDKQKSEISPNKQKELLENAIPEFEDFFQPIIVNVTNDGFEEDLTKKEKKYLALKMLLEYYRQEIVKWSTIVNLVTGSTKMSGIGDVKKSLQENYNQIEKEINQLLATLV